MIEQGRQWGISFEQFCARRAHRIVGWCWAQGFILTRPAKRRGQKIWDPVTRRLIVELAIPLFTGGVFCLILLYHGAVGFVSPAMLIFYGLALVNASKYTLPDVRLLGLSEIALGLIALFRIGNGLECWAAGFGLLHIIYGAMMYYRVRTKCDPVMKHISTQLNKAFDHHQARPDVGFKYNTLKELLDTTDGNLASHVKALEAENYIEVKKQFIGRRPNTSYAATALGRKAFNDHLDALEQLLKARD